MHRLGKFIVKFRKIILIIGLLLLIPSIMGYISTRVNYDILVYLPEDIETVQGEEVLTEEFHMGSYAIIVVENMSNREILKIEKQIKKVDHVEMVLSAADVVGTSIPIEFLPKEISEIAYKDNTTFMLATFDESVSNDNTLEAVQNIRNLLDDRCKVSGMSAIVLDTKTLSDSEMLAYIIIAVILCIIVLQLALDSYFAPFLLLLNIGIAILYNMGSNYFLGEISYITKAISAVLQLGVTTDFAIFLYHSYSEERKRVDSNEEAMAIAISKTFVSVLGSSLTTIAGFLALCSMRFTLGKDIGIVMAKGVLMGVICVLTILPSLILECNKLIDKTRHKEILPEFVHIKNLGMKHYKVIIVLFILILPFAYYGYTHTDVYYNLDKSLPKELSSVSANAEILEKFDMASQEIVLINKDIPDEEMMEMLDRIENLDGVKWTIGLSKISKYGIPKAIIPEDILYKIQNDDYQLLLINSVYEMATDELNDQVGKINTIVKEYDENAIIAGEGALMKDLVEIADHDFRSVNSSSIAVIFIIMIFVLKSLTLPIILICVIEFAIFINMGIPFYTGTELAFVASIIIGTIQLGATIDYAILITTKYINQRKQGKNKNESLDYALGTSIKSIFVSGLCFFSATFGVGAYSRIEMIGSLCTLMARGAIISMISVVLILPAFIQLFDKIICKTTLGLKENDIRKEV